MNPNAEFFCLPFWVWIILGLAGIGVFLADLKGARLRPPRWILLLAFLGAAGDARAQHPRDIEEWTTEAVTPDGREFQAPIPLDMLRENTVGTDNAGLCVGSSFANAATYHGQKDAADALMERLRRKPGGSIPSRMEGDLRAIRERFPDLSWLQYEGDDFRFAEDWLKKGRLICNTYGTGRPYGMRLIHHMVNTVHLDEAWGVIADNNPIYRGPGADKRGFAYVCLPRPEYERRTTMDGGWFGVIQSGTVPGRLGLPEGEILPVFLFLGFSLATAGVLLTGSVAGAVIISRS